MPQGERSPAEKASFNHMLRNVNFLYLGCKVLILLDKRFISRFWTQFEAYIAMRQASEQGLIDAPNEARWTADVPYSTDPDSEESKFAKAQLKATWAHCTVEDAFDKLSKPDIAVTNQSDKEIMLPKLRALDQEVKAMMTRRSSVLSKDELRAMLLGSGRKLEEQARSMSRRARRGSNASKDLLRPESQSSPLNTSLGGSANLPRPRVQLQQSV